MPTRKKGLKKCGYLGNGDVGLRWRRGQLCPLAANNWAAFESSLVLYTWPDVTWRQRTNGVSATSRGATLKRRNFLGFFVCGYLTKECFKLNFARLLPLQRHVHSSSTESTHVHRANNFPFWFNNINQQWNRKRGLLTSTTLTADIESSLSNRVQITTSWFKFYLWCSALKLIIQLKLAG